MLQIHKVYKGMDDPGFFNARTKKSQVSTAVQIFDAVTDPGLRWNRFYRV